MDPRDRLRSQLAGVGCAVCGIRLPSDRIRILAQREQLIFVELRCASCGTDTLGMVTIAADEPEGAVMLDLAPYGEFGPIDDARLAGARPLELDDVLAMHTFLSGYHGDVRGLLGETGGPAGPGRSA